VDVLEVSSTRMVILRTGLLTATPCISFLSITLRLNTGERTPILALRTLVRTQVTDRCRSLQDSNGGNIGSVIA
jgi:hypothetical protein